MINPCTRECPNRTPGCDCEKRKAWKWQQEQIRESQKRERLVAGYRREKIRSSRRKTRRYKWDQ